MTVEDSRFEGNAITSLFLQVAKANVTRSIASGNEYGIGFQGGTANNTETTAADNADQGFYFHDGAAVTLASSVVRGNATGLRLLSGAASVSITDCVITSNPTAINNGGTLYTRENNTVGGPCHRQRSNSVCGVLRCARRR